MKMLSYTTIICSCMLALATPALHAQEPSSDPHWELSFTDDFNSFNTAKWLAKHNYDAYGSINMNPLVHLNTPANVNIQSGNLVLRLNKMNYSCPPEALYMYGCDKQSVTGETYTYTSGYVESVAQNFNYGYVEARIKVPEVFGINSAFWTLVHDGAQPYSEIDIFEMLPGINKFNIGYHDRNIMTTNVHYRVNGVPAEKPWFNGVNDYRQYHIYGMEWSPELIVWYVDYKEVRRIPNPGVHKPQKLIMSMGFYDGHNSLPPANQLPAPMYIDWIRYYKLRKDCAVPLQACNYNFAQHDNKVKKFIRIGGNGCTNSLAVNSKTVLRAAEGIEILGDFTVPVGAECYMEVSACE